MFGDIDLIIFDNIMSLIVGDMREETSWAPVKQWIFSLTARKVGQLWVHHTGYDESRGYGTSTREWDMDTVMHLDRVARADTDVSFTFSFTKARERTPATRQDFGDITVALVNDAWTWSSEKGQERGNLTLLDKKYLEALRTVAAANPESANAPFPVSTVSEWRDECRRVGLIDPEKPDSARTMFSQYRRKLIAANYIGVDGETVQVLA
jgi:hypothetical protein